MKDRSREMSKTVYILNGPNLNLLGQREPDIYGCETLDDLANTCTMLANAAGMSVKCLQSNYEGQLVNWIHEARHEAAGIIINPGAYSHTSIAIHDALKAFEGRIIEVHISNIHRRESFRHHSYVSLCADGVIAGLGLHGYGLALESMGRLLN
jgi:3-dehydroquinate dehydratase-2